LVADNHPHGYVQPFIVNNQYVMDLTDRIWYYSCLTLSTTFI
jgi:hypothetical protein